MTMTMRMTTHLSAEFCLAGLNSLLLRRVERQMPPVYMAFVVSTEGVAVGVGVGVGEGMGQLQRASTPVIYSSALKANILPLQIRRRLSLFDPTPHARNYLSQRGVARRRETGTFENAGEED